MRGSPLRGHCHSESGRQTLPLATSLALASSTILIATPFLTPPTAPARGGLVFKAHRLVHLNLMLESHTSQEKKLARGWRGKGVRFLTHLLPTRLCLDMSLRGERSRTALERQSRSKGNLQPVAATHSSKYGVFEEIAGGMRLPRRRPQKAGVVESHKQTGFVISNQLPQQIDANI